MVELLMMVLAEAAGAALVALVVAAVNRLTTREPALAR
jgi:hypothetical protein